MTVVPNFFTKMLKLDQHVIYVLMNWDEKEYFPIVCSSYNRMVKVVEFLKEKNYKKPTVYCYYRGQKICGFAYSTEKTNLMQNQVNKIYAKR